MKLRTKLTVTFLSISLVSAAAVGGIAYWMLMRDFRQSILEQAFLNFQEDVQRYILFYGSWQQGERSEPFPLFVSRVRRSLQRTPPIQNSGPPPINRKGRAPFLFLLLDPDGRVIKEGGEYHQGQRVPASLHEQARPIYVNGRVQALAVPLGDPNLTPQDMQYLVAMRQSLINGFLFAGSLAILLGFLLSRRAVASLDELTRATHAMQRNGELDQQVPVRSNDEIGELAMAFNSMSSQLSDAHSELRELSIRDPLTQLYNRRHFTEQSQSLYQQASRFGHPLTVMIGDLDHFKRINDTLSHAVGDAVLQRVADLLRRHTRSSDIVARHGGEEFVITFAETPLAQAAKHCEALRQKIENHPWEEIHPKLRVTMSMGLSDNHASGSIEKMLNEADTHLYAAKDAGRNRVMPALAMG